MKPCGFMSEMAMPPCLVRRGLCCVLPAAAFAAEMNALPQTKIPWIATPKAAGSAALEGDRFTERYMVVARLLRGLASPLHGKPAGVFGVVAEGTFVHRASGSDPADDIPLRPGSNDYIPVGPPHIGACNSETPCFAFLYQDGVFDFNVVDP